MGDIQIWQVVVVGFIGAVAGGAGKHFWTSLRGNDPPAVSQKYAPELCLLKHKVIDAKLGEHAQALEGGRKNFNELRGCINEIKGDVKVLLERTKE